MLFFVTMRWRIANAVPESIFRFADIKRYGDIMLTLYLTQAFGIADNEDATLTQYLPQPFVIADTLTMLDRLHLLTLPYTLTLHLTPPLTNATASFSPTGQGVS